MAGQITFGIREVGCHREIDGIKGDLLAFVPGVQVMEDETDRCFNPPHLTHRRIALQHTDIGASPGIKGKGRAYFGHAIQIKGQGKYGEQHVVPRDGKVVNHRRIGRLKALRPFDHAIRSDHVIGHGFAADRTRHVTEAM